MIFVGTTAGCFDWTPKQPCTFDFKDFTMANNWGKQPPALPVYSTRVGYTELLGSGSSST